MAKLETDMQNGHNDCRGSGKYGKRAAYGRGISHSCTYRRSAYP